MKNQAKQTDVVYREVQQLRQVWLWVVVLIAAALMWYAAARQLLLGIPFGSGAISDQNMTLCWLIFGVVIPALGLSIRLVTEVRDDGVYVRFFPLQFRPTRIAFTEIKGCKLRARRRPLGRGSRGARRTARNGARSEPDHDAIELQLRGGEPVVIGSLQPQELHKAIQAQIRRARHLASGSQGEG